MPQILNSFPENTKFPFLNSIIISFIFFRTKFSPMVSNLSNAMAGKTARACDSCIRKRARWYCAADDAFLCQSCDGSVHSANPLARRHDRVRLQTVSVEPPWTTGFTRKARTPRRKTKSDGYIRDPVDDQVPEIGVDETTSYDETSEEHVMYRVPFIGNGNIDNYMEFDDFGGDVESLLGFDMEDLGLVNCGEESSSMEGSSGSGRRVKFEKEEEMDIIVNDQVDMQRDTIFEVNFDNYECTPLMAMKESSEDFEVGDVKKKKVLLALDYEGVIAAWTSERPPWTTGDRPEVDPSDSWLNCMVVFSSLHVDHLYFSLINIYLRVLLIN